MSTLRSAIDELHLSEMRSASDAELVSDVDEIEHAERRLAAERSRRLAELERRRVYEPDGHLSLATWLAARHGTPASVSAWHVRLGRALERWPRVAEALTDGSLSVQAARMVASALETCPDAFSRSEEQLLDAARVLPIAGLRTLLEHLRQAHDLADAERTHEERFARRRLYISPTLDGMVRVDGDLDPETGQEVISALRAVTDVEARSADRADGRTPAQRRADALGEVCRWWLDAAGRPTVAGERPHVVVTLDLDALEGRAGRSELPDTGSVTPEIARRIACDANVSRVVTRGASQPLEAGRTSKVVPSALRRALTVRDRGCRFPSCGRPPGWCDAHHVVHWADGGETGLGNLVLLCRPHHRLIHRGFGVEIVSGQPVFRRPDGSRLDERAPP